MIAKEGRRFIIPLFVLAVIAIILMMVFPLLPIKILAVISTLLLLFTTWFFRDPERVPDNDETIVVSPADGRVVAYDEIHDEFVGNAKLISIFMSVFNVHVNRMPADGKIVEEKYFPGNFMSAYNPAASFENERRRINIDGGVDRRYGVTQVAGMVARRIVPYLATGDSGKKGDKFGMICFGSRVDIIMPADIVVQITLNQKLKAGKTVLGIYK